MCWARAMPSCRASCAAGSRAKPLETCATWANACGAFAVSRLLCSPEIPTWDELQYFLKHGSPQQALRKDETINHIHWATTRRRADRDSSLPSPSITASSWRTWPTGVGRPRDRIADFKRLAVAATAKVANGGPGFGMLLDDTYGREAMFDAAKLDFWIGRPLEVPGSRPLRFEFTQDVGRTARRMADRPYDQVPCLLSSRRCRRAEERTDRRSCARSMMRRARSAANC